MAAAAGSRPAAGGGGQLPAAPAEVARFFADVRTALERHPSAALHPVLIRWFTFMCTTSQVERDFAKMLHTLRLQQSRAGQEAEADTAKCVLDYVASEELEVLEVAGTPMQHGNAAIVAPSMLVAVHRSMWFPAMPQM